MKKEKTIFLHIGLPKTGTTTIQYGLRDNYAFLLERGWLYPKAARNYQEGSAHHNIVFELNKSQLFVPEAGGVSELAAEIKNSTASNIIISSEQFNGNEIPFLHELLSKLGTVKIVIFIRNQIKSLPSVWGQLVKTCKTGKAFEEWYFNKKHPIGQYSKQIDLWAKTFGKNNIILKPLENNSGNLNILGEFLLACGFQDIQNLIIPKNKNITPGLKTLELIRYFTNYFGVSTKEKYWLHFSSFLSRSIIEFSEKRDWNNEKWQIMSKELEMEIRDHFKKENEYLAKHYLNKDVLFEEEPIFDENQMFHIEDIPPQDILDLMNFILEKIYESPNELLRIKNTWKKEHKKLLGSVDNSS